MKWDRCKLLNPNTTNKWCLLEINNNINSNSSMIKCNSTVKLPLKTTKIRSSIIQCHHNNSMITLNSFQRSKLALHHKWELLSKCLKNNRFFHRIRCWWTVITIHNSINLQWEWACRTWLWKELESFTADSNKEGIAFQIMFWETLWAHLIYRIKSIIIHIHIFKRESITHQVSKIWGKLLKLDKLIRWNGDKDKSLQSKMQSLLQAIQDLLARWVTINSISTLSQVQDVSIRNILATLALNQIWIT